MTIYDVFNGDADGICALQQFRLANPAKSTLITGVKRDIKLLEQFSSSTGDVINVFDISLDKNAKGLETHLSSASEIKYFDHHFAGEPQSHENLELYIDTSPETCTAVIVDNYLGGKFKKWAITGAFGDGFDDLANQMANSIDLNADDTLKLRTLGNLINYNAYGSSLNDLHIAPAELFQKLSSYEDPLDFLNDSAFSLLNEGFTKDRALADNLKPVYESEKQALYKLPNEKWARRVSGVFANELNKQFKERAHALLTDIGNNNYLVSVRAPATTKTGADDLCRQFETGGGRKAAAGINRLPSSEYDNFLAKFIEQFP